jgi:hypothetical protein
LLHEWDRADKRQAQEIFHRHGLDGAFWSLG